MLEARYLSKSYSSVPAIRDVAFSLEPGQVLGCVGPNGAGKSTTVRMLTGLISPSFGRVHFKGEDIQVDLARYRKSLGYVPEEPHLYPYLSGYEYLEMIGLLRLMPPEALKEKVECLLNLFSLYPHRHATIGAYSKGMRQRILLIAALMHDPPLLILDEPLSGLDVTTALIFKNLIKGLGKKGKAIFYCSHVLEVVEQVCSHLLILRKGQVIASGTMAEVRRDLPQASLESAFMHLVEEGDAGKRADEIIAAMEAS